MSLEWGGDNRAGAGWLGLCSFSWPLSHRCALVCEGPRPSFVLHAMGRASSVALVPSGQGGGHKEGAELLQRPGGAWLSTRVGVHLPVRGHPWHHPQLACDA